MHITLTDRLTCPRCGPGAGLIVLMDEVADRRVVSGSLGCPVCRERYPISGRVADLRLGDAGEATGPAPAGVEARAEARAEVRAAADDVEPGVAGAGGRADEAAVRVAALLGLGEGSGFVVLDGPDALAVAARLRGLAPEYEPVVVVPEAGAAAAGASAVSALMIDAALPMADSLMRGAAYVGAAPAAERLAELVRVVRPTSRVLVDGVDTSELDGVVAVLEGLGAQVRARDGGGVVAVVM